jgi:hypothetical protein
MSDERANHRSESAGDETVPLDGIAPSRAVGRRRFVQGSAALAGGIAAASYVKPNMQSLGIPSALAVSGGDPPPLSGLTPGGWGNSGNWWGPGPQPVWVPDESGYTQGSPYVGMWDATNDPDWVGGALGQPFAHGDLFNSFFEPSAALATIGMGSLNDEMLEILTGGAGSVWPAKTARDVIAAYLNASYFGASYPYSQGEIKDMWKAAILALEQPAAGVSPSNALLEKLHIMLDAANNGSTTKLPWP